MIQDLEERMYLICYVVDRDTLAKLHDVTMQSQNKRTACFGLAVPADKLESRSFWKFTGISFGRAFAEFFRAKPEAEQASA